MLIRRLYPVLLLLGVVACRTGRDYPASDAPRYAGVPADTTVRRCDRPCEIRIVSFNIEFARNIDGAIAVLTSDTALRKADIVLLQEMDAKGTRRIAEALRMWHVYYPAVYHRRTRRDFGNAVLSRFPIVADAKLILPYASRYAGTHRIATAATVRIGGTSVRVYSTHLGTVADITSGQRRNQLRAILSDGEKYPLVVLGGDINDEKLPSLAEKSSYVWPTRYGPRTTSTGRLDHILMKGMQSRRSGTVILSSGVSDHHPVWASAILPE